MQIEKLFLNWEESKPYFKVLKRQDYIGLAEMMNVVRPDGQDLSKLDVNEVVELVQKDKGEDRADRFSVFL